MASSSSKDAVIELALSEYRQGVHSSLRAAAAAHSLSPSTIIRRANGTTKSHREAAGAAQVLPPALEHQLEQWILQCEKAQRPVSFGQLRDFAQMLAQSAGHIQPLGKHWVLRFIKRHPALSSKIGRARAKAAPASGQIPHQASKPPRLQRVRLCIGSLQQLDPSPPQLDPGLPQLDSNLQRANPSLQPLDSIPQRRLHGSRRQSDKSNGEKEPTLEEWETIFERYQHLV